MSEPITAEMRRQARQQPQSWLYLTDPAYAEATEVPPWAVIGAYEVDDRGEVLEKFYENPNFQGLAPEPANDLEEALLATLTGAADEQHALALLETSELIVVTSEDGTQIPVLADDGEEFLPVFTSQQYVPENAPGVQLVSLAWLRPLLTGRSLAINPDGPLSMTITGDELAH